MTTTDNPTAPPNGRARTVLNVRPRADFVATEATHDLTERALMYIQAGFPVHFRGPAGSGKTTLALHVAAQLGRPVMLMVGDEEFQTSDLVGAAQGYRYRKVVDRFIHSVLKYEEDATQQWVDNRLTTACREGFTLVYDEFTRSRPEANNILLTVLEERLLILPNVASDAAYIKVHPEFRAIFTSNPQEYAGVHEAQDALSDRMITLDLGFYDRETEIYITAARAGLPREAVAPIVDIVRDFRASGEYDQLPTMRAAIMIAKIAARQGVPVSADDRRFAQICLDVLESKKAFAQQASDQRMRQREMLLSLLRHHTSSASETSS
jgi:gas vesicle protein GvpN